ncbi:MAG TPA: SMP-30/gluconolactonase/LRE family protein [Thermoanaerobaculia bacterium]|nr:SMP-30/gluconolactonase/LRE family protein [Thermoanaerobaculia bacterium]
MMPFTMMRRILSPAVFILPLLSALAIPVTAQEEKPLVQHIGRMLQVSPDQRGLWVEMAAAYARAGNDTEAARWLKRAIDQKLDFDLADNPDFARLLAKPDGKALLTGAEANRRVVQRGKVAFQIPQKDLVPEGIAHDSKTGDFFVSSTLQKKIVRVDKAGKASDFTASGQDGLQGVLGMRVDSASRTLWACSGPSARVSPEPSHLFRFDLATGGLKGKHELPGKPPHLCNDIALGKGGDVFVTDSTGGAVHRLRPGKEALETLLAPGTLIYPNGLAISSDGKRLYVADFKGLSFVDVATGKVEPLKYPEQVNVTGLDGLYLYGGHLVAVQNSSGTARVVRFKLNAAKTAILSEEILESRNPLFVVPTTGVISGSSLFLVANSHLESVDDQGKLKPDAPLGEATILQIPLGR